MKKTYIISISIFLIISAGIVLFQHLSNSNIIIIPLNILASIAVTINVFLIINVINLEKKFTSIYTLFQCLSLPFLYGQIFLREVLNYTPKIYFDLMILVTEESIIKALFLMIFSQIAIHIGYLLYTGISKQKKEEKKKFEHNIEIKTLKKVGLVLFCVSVVPAIYNFVETYNATSIQGYTGMSEVRYTGIASVLLNLTPIFMISLFMLMVAWKESKIKSRGVLIFAILFYGVQILFSERGIPIIAVLTVLWLYNITVEKISKKIIIALIISILPLTILFNIIRTQRDSSGFSTWIDNIEEIWNENIVDTNPIYDTVFEMGTAIYPITYTLEYIPNRAEYKYGESYLLSIYSVVSINSGDTVNDLASRMNIATEVTEEAGAPFGGSYIQEAYANFGYFSIIFMIFLGVVLGILQGKIDRNTKLIVIILIAYMLNPFLWTIRNVMITLPRELCWYAIPIYWYYKFEYNGVKKNEKKLQ